MDKKAILIVEDEKPLQRVLGDKLEKEGFNVLLAGNGKEGLEIALKSHPDLILLDMVMPIMNGIAMLKKLREDDWGRNAPVIILSNLTNVNQAAEAIHADVHDYLIKCDWKIADVVKMVKEKLN